MYQNTQQALADTWIIGRHESCKVGDIGVNLAPGSVTFIN